MNILPKVNKIYYFFTSLLVLIPPLSLGLTMIYFSDENYTDMKLAMIGLIMNYSFVVIIFGVSILLIKLGRIGLPKIEDWSFLIFGLIANIAIYLFVFQEQLNIEDAIDIYIVTIVLLGFYWLLVNKTKLNFELWFLSIFFFIFYRFHVAFMEMDWSQYGNYIETTWLIRLAYVTVPLISVIVIGYKAYKTKYFNGFSYAVIAIYIITLLYLFEAIETDSKFFLTLFFILPFIFIVDLIIARINKNPNPNRIIFYLRAATLIIITLILRMSEYLTLNTYSHEEMYMMTFIMSAVIFINVISYFLPKQKEESFDYTKTIALIKKVQDNLVFIENEEDADKANELLEDVKQIIEKK